MLAHSVERFRNTRHILQCLSQSLQPLRQRQVRGGRRSHWDRLTLGGSERCGIKDEGRVERDCCNGAANNRREGRGKGEGGAKKESGKLIERWTAPDIHLGGRLGGDSGGFRRWF